MARPTIHIVIEGPPGSGKSEVQRAVVEALWRLRNSKHGAVFEVSTTNEDVIDVGQKFADTVVIR